MSLFDAIPEAYRSAARQAIAETCGEVAISAITPLLGGRSTALVYRVDAAEKRYVLRIITQRNPLTDPPRQFAAMQVASDLGVAPHVYHTNADSGIAVTAFIPTQAWQTSFSADANRVTDLGRCVRRLHDGPAMPPFLDAFQCIEQALIGIKATGATLSPMLSAYLEDFSVVRDTLRPHCVLGASHNDLNPGNLLFDGERPWIIDWESAWQNDPLFDVATMLHWFGFSGATELALFDGYFGGAPMPLQAAKLELMKQVVSCYYAVVFLLITMQTGEVPPSLDPDPDSLPAFSDTRSGMQLGSFALDTAEARTRFSLIMINDARRAMARPAFKDAMELLQQQST